MSCADTLYSENDFHPHLCLVATADMISRFFPLLQRGVMVRVRVGCSVRKFLSDEIGVSPEALERIQSIFLDGGPVDDLDSAMIRDGSSLALSAAMPGLVGATMRRGGAYSSFRSTITHRETGAPCASGSGFVQVKLFNLMTGELGPGLLAKGIFVTSSEFRDFLAGQDADFWLGCRDAFLDGRPVEAGALKDGSWLSGHDRIFLSITLAGNG